MEEKLPEGVVHKPLVPFMHLVEYGPMMERQKFDVPAEGVLEGGKAKTNFDAQVKRLVDGL
ncbi:MAG: hypothetical protein GWN00_39190, partial [Aliifodinibius sp.]|nr:hypothetical protein [Fodinibius sp.]NIV10943.1 hypothetical protein [Fodinibius sp.]NIY30590.1 hypothetical protein [Fodinibius sp.]